ncbi:MAG: hypothetical protein ABIN61_03090 [candidate division WOR-3 bacterium]
MARWMWIFLILVLVLSCENPFSIRMTADYFPLKEGNKWIYKVKEENYQVVVEVIEDRENLFGVDVGGDLQYFERKKGIVNKVRDLVKTYEGDKIYFGKVYEPYLFLPPIEGENWEREFTFFTTYKGDTVRKYLYISIDSVKSTDVILNNTKYNNVYQMRRKVIEDEDTLLQYEWFAPNVGLIKRVIMPDSIVWELLSYIVKE